MIDPVSATSLAVELTAICIKVVKQLKETIETMKKAREDLLELLNRTERMRNILELLRTLLLELARTPHRDMAIGLNTEACRRTMDELQSLADKIAGTKLAHPLLGAVQWARYKGEAMELVTRLRSQETDVVNTLVIIGVHSSLKTEEQVTRLRDKAVSEAEVTSAFDGLTLLEDSLLAPAREPGTFEPIRTWLGHVVQEGHSEHYLTSREGLRNAAYWGDWEAFWPALNIGLDEYTESWVNATRLKPLDEAHEMSLWTPLHQAVYSHVDDEASSILIERLLRAGAFRTLRSQWTPGFSYPNMTALEMAQDLGYQTLYSILSPVIHQPVPADILAVLQDKFHDLIRKDLGDRVEQEYINLPVLEVLTELELPQMWFPVKFHKFSPAGYVYRLDRRELIVKAYNIEEADTAQTYRITHEDTFIVDEALVFGS